VKIPALMRVHHNVRGTRAKTGQFTDSGIRSLHNDTNLRDSLTKAGYGELATQLWDCLKAYYARWCEGWDPCLGEWATARQHVPAVYLPCRSPLCDRCEPPTLRRARLALVARPNDRHVRGHEEYQALWSRGAVVVRREIDLPENDLDDCLKQVRQDVRDRHRAAGKPGAILDIHVPKWAGGTVTVRATVVLPAGANIDPFVRRGWRPVGHPANHKALARFLDGLPNAFVVQADGPGFDAAVRRLGPGGRRAPRRTTHLGPAKTLFATVELASECSVDGCPEIDRPRPLREGERVDLRRRHRRIYKAVVGRGLPADPPAYEANSAARGQDWH